MMTGLFLYFALFLDNAHVLFINVLVWCSGFNFLTLLFPFTNFILTFYKWLPLIVPRNHTYKR